MSWDAYPLNWVSVFQQRATQLWIYQRTAGENKNCEVPGPKEHMSVASIVLERRDW